MLAVAFQGLEIIQRHDAMRAKSVKKRDRHNLERRHAGGQNGRPGEPGQPFVAQADKPRPPPARPLEPNRFGRIGPGRQHAQHGRGKAPGAKHPAQRQRQARHGQRNPQAPAAGDPARGDRAVWFVHRIDMTVAPVICGLAHAADHRTGQHDAQDHQGKRRQGRGPDRHHATQVSPHRREPGDRLDQLQHRARLRIGG